MPRFRLTGDYGTFEISRVVEAANEGAAWAQTGIRSTLMENGWAMTTPDGEEWEVTEC